MPRKTLSQISASIQSLLQSEGELSVRQIARLTHTQWRTADKALELLKSLGLIEERRSDNNKRNERLFRLIK